MLRKLNLILALLLFCAPLQLIAEKISIISKKIAVLPSLGSPFGAIQAEGNTIQADNDFIYLSGPGGLYRISKDSAEKGGTWENILPFSNINGVHLTGGLLFVTQYRGYVGDILESHSILYSNNQGTSFAPADRGLKVCEPGQECSDLDVTQVRYIKGILYANTVADELLVSKDLGETFTNTAGQELGTLICYYNTFEFLEEEVLIGGECPLDSAYIIKGKLNLLTGLWDPSYPKKVILDNHVISNRNVQFIKKIDNSAVVFSGHEGAIYRSTDNGESFQATELINNENISSLYPYVISLAHLGGRPRKLFAGGWHQNHQAAGWLGFSNNYGKKWRSITRLVSTNGIRPNNISGILTINRKKAYVAVVNFATNAVEVWKLKIKVARE